MTLPIMIGSCCCAEVLANKAEPGNQHAKFHVSARTARLADRTRFQAGCMDSISLERGAGPAR